MKQIKKTWQNIDPFSLQLRLTVGIASFSALVLGGLAIWTSWKTQKILIDNHKHNIEQIAKRLPRDVQIYSEMMQPETGLQKAINNLASHNTLLWVKNSENQILAQSNTLNLLSNSMVSELMSLTKMPIKPQVYKINQNYFVFCGGSVEVQGKLLGELFVVKDISREQTMFVGLVRSLGIISLLIIIILTVAIAIYIKHSLQPLRQLNQMAAVISAEDLGQAQLYLDNAPSEVKELAQTLTMLLSRLSQSWEQEKIGRAHV